MRGESEKYRQTDRQRDWLDNTLCEATQKFATEIIKTIFLQKHPIAEMYLKQSKIFIKNRLFLWSFKGRKKAKT